MCELLWIPDCFNSATPYLVRIVVENHNAHGINLSCVYARHVDIWGNGGIAPFILNVGNRWLHNRLKGRKYLLNKTVGKPQSQSGCFR